jgi:hypothetical protein
MVAFVLKGGSIELILRWVGAPVSLDLVVRTAASGSPTPDSRGVAPAQSHHHIH